MTDYGKRKCELLEKKGFDANNFAWWVESEDEGSRTYGFVRKDVGSEVCRLTISLIDDVRQMNGLYKAIKEQMAEVKAYNEENDGKDEIVCEYADYDWMFSDISEKAALIRELNYRVHEIEEELPWDEVSAWFESADDAGAWEPVDTL